MKINGCVKRMIFVLLVLMVFALMSGCIRDKSPIAPYERSEWHELIVVDTSQVMHAVVLVVADDIAHAELDSIKWEDKNGQLHLPLDWGYEYSDAKYRYYYVLIEHYLKDEINRILGKGIL